MTETERWTQIRELVDALPETYERQFGSGASRFYVRDTCFAYQSADLTSLVVAVEPVEWEALQLAGEPGRQPLPPATPRQRARYVALDLSAIDGAQVEAELRSAWTESAPRSLRRGMDQDA